MYFILHVILLFSINMVYSQEWVVHMDKEYLFSNETQIWNSSREICNNMSADLASIGESGEQTFLSETIGNSQSGNEPQYWVGLMTSSTSDACNVNTMLLNCSAANHTHNCCRARLMWTWTDKTPMYFMHWMVNEPSNNNTCGRIVYYNESESFWHEVACTSHYRYICERALPTSPSPSPFLTPTSSVSTSKSSSSNTTASGVGVGVAGCLLLAAAILAAVCLIQRRRREKQALAKTHITIVPVDAPFTQTTLKEDCKTGAITYNNNHAPKATEHSKANATDYTNNNTEEVDSPYEPVAQTMYADIKFSSTQRQLETPERAVRAAQTLPQRQVEYADLRFDTNHTDSYAEVQKPASGIIEYASAYDVTTVQSPSHTHTYAKLLKPAKPKQAVKPQPKNTQNAAKETKTPPPPDVDAEQWL